MYDLLFEILAKYGAPPALIDVIRRLHDNFNLKLVFDKKNKAFIDYSGCRCTPRRQHGWTTLFILNASYG
jgi:hypothetical protein